MSDLTVAQLKSELKKLGVEFDSKSKKAKLVELFLQNKSQPKVKDKGGKKKKGNDQNNNNDVEEKEEKKSAKKKPKIIPKDKEENEENKKEEEEEEEDFGFGPVFKGLPEEYRRVRDYIEKHDKSEKFLGVHRSKGIVPIREMTLQALKLPPSQWKLVIVSQSPFPRVESATGIGLFDNRFHSWEDPDFSKTTSLRCLLKGVLMDRLSIPKDTKVDKLRELLRSHKVCAPPEWFGALLSQGVLFLNASMTVSVDDAISLKDHTDFWRPIVKIVIETILSARQQEGIGIVFAWWGKKAESLRPLIEQISKNYKLDVRHVVHTDPAARFDKFCDKNVFQEIDRELKAIGEQSSIDWLPKKEELTHERSKMNKFILDSSALHKTFLERLGGIEKEEMKEMEPIILGTKKTTFQDACAPLYDVIGGIEDSIEESKEFAENSDCDRLSFDQIASVFLYTQPGAFYRRLNEALRNPNRKALKPYLGFLRLFHSALEELNKEPQKKKPMLYRGVKLDLRKQYKEQTTITWWGVSSTTSAKWVAEEFVGNNGPRMLFVISSFSAVSVKHVSCLPDEEEWVLPAGSVLEVSSVRHTSNGLTLVHLQETEKRMVTP